MSSANEIQHGGDHYRAKGLQHWDIMSRYNVPYLEGNSSKYGYRWEKKNGLEDLTKFQHYVQKITELHLQEGYINEALVPMGVWYRFCEENGVDDLSTQATYLILNWTTMEDLLMCQDRVQKLIARQTTYT